MIMKIFSVYGEHDCVPMTLQDITEVLHAEEEINSTVTADNKDTESASDSC